MGLGVECLGSRGLGRPVRDEIGGSWYMWAEASFGFAAKDRASSPVKPRALCVKLLEKSGSWQALFGVAGLLGSLLA